jgi:hypothetical protein
MIPQVDEQQTAVIPAVVQPPGESHVRTYVFDGQLTTGMAAVSMHDIPTGLDISAGELARTPRASVGQYS